MGGLPPVFIEFIGNDMGFKATVRGVKTGIKEVEAEGSRGFGGLGKIGSAALIGIGGAVLGLAGKTVEMAASFQTAMVGISTQAGVPKAQLKSLGDGVLKLAGQVGFAPDSLAEALYHIESSFASVGIKGPTAMNLLKVAAQGAAVGHANLVDVTNALDAAVASGIPGVQNFSQAMGALNAIVGSGDMEMQDLADAMSTGMVAAVKGYGLSLNDVGAALATFGDNNIRGQNAATDLRMAVQALSVPAKGADKYLAQFGWTVNTLGNDMKKGGLSLALNDLMKKFKENKIGAKDMGQVITTMFGKKAGVGLQVLMSQLDRVNSKYPEIEKGANGFGAAVAENEQTFSQKMKEAQASVQALGVRIGTALLPYAIKFLGWIQQSITWLQTHKRTVELVGGALMGVLVVGLHAATMAAQEFAIALLADPLTWIVIGVLAVGAAIVLLIQHFGQISAYIKGHFPGVVSFFVNLWHNAMHMFSEAWHFAMMEVGRLAKWFDANVLKWIQARGADFTKWWSKNGAEVMKVWGLVWSWIQTYATIVWGYIHVGLVLLGAIFQAAWDLIVGVIKLAWTIIADAVTFGIHLVMNVVALIMDIITGHWGKAWHDLIKLVSQAFADIWHFLAGVVGGIGDLLWNVGKDIIMGIVHGIEAAGSAIWNSLKSIASSALKSLKSFFGINSPSRVFADEVGKWIPHGIAQGIDKHANVAVAAVKRLGLAMTGNISGAGSLGFAVEGGGLSTGTSAYAGGSSVTNVVNVTVQGTVRSDRDLRDVLQQEMLRLGGRNSSTWAPYRR